MPNKTKNNPKKLISQTREEFSELMPMTGKIKTHYGTFELKYGTLTEETSKKLYYEMDYHRAVQCYLWSLPIVGLTQWRESIVNSYRAKANDLIYVKSFDDRAGVLTANETTPYLWGFLNVRDKATIIEVPKGLTVGLVVDFWQRGLADFGRFGVDQQSGGFHIITGPTTPQEDMPDIAGGNYVKSTTNNLWIVFRMVGTEQDHKNILDNVKVYSYGDKPKGNIIAANNKSAHCYQPRGIIYWELLHKILQEEPVDERDRFFMYWLRDLGIEKDKPFRPTKYQKEILTDAIVVGELMAKNLVFHERLSGVLRKDGWRRIMGGKPGHGIDATQHTKYYDVFDPRARYTYEAITTSPRMNTPRPGLGMGYIGRFVDSNNHSIKGEKSYVILIPPDPPAELFWSCVIYDIDTRAIIETDKKKATIGSKTKGIQKIKDGSIPVFVGPKAPKGWESNWIKSIPKRGWFPYIRLYGPGEAFFDESYIMPQIEEVDFKDWAK